MSRKSLFSPEKKLYILQELEQGGHSLLSAAPGSTPMLHSYRGFQYTSLAFKKRLEDHGLTQSMSRVGKCIDDYIYFYNYERLQSKLNSLSPIEFRNKAA
ncbi:MAG: IS3 family transposase [Veillonellaceae bacterium]|nr:IS3 family transposase [Veillonellaceae bacterium]